MIVLSLKGRHIIAPPKSSSSSVSSTSSSGTIGGIPAIATYLPINFVPETTCSSDCVIETLAEATILDADGFALTELGTGAVVLDTDESSTNTRQKWVFLKLQDPGNGFSATYRISNKQTGKVLTLSEDGYFFIASTLDTSSTRQSWKVHRLGTDKTGPVGVVSTFNNGAWYKTSGAGVVMIQPDQTFSLPDFRFTLFV
jgi:hypothetical protein